MFRFYIPQLHLHKLRWTRLRIQGTNYMFVFTFRLYRSVKSIAFDSGIRGVSTKPYGMADASKSDSCLICGRWKNVAERSGGGFIT